MPFFKSGRQR